MKFWFRPDACCSRWFRAGLWLAHIGGVVCGAAFLLPASAVQAGEPMLLEAKIPLGKVSGRIDHFAIDLERRRLFVAELGNNSVGVIDLNKGELIRNIAGLKEPQGVAYEKSADTLFVASAGDGSLRLFRGAELPNAGRIELGEDADNIRVDKNGRKVFVGYGAGALAVIDPATRTKLTSIPLPAILRAFSWIVPRREFS